MQVNWKEKELDKTSIRTVNYGTLIKYGEIYCIVTEYGDNYRDPDHAAEAENKVLAIDIVDGSLVWIDTEEEVIELEPGIDYTLEITD